MTTIADQLAAALEDMHSGWIYIRQSHGDLYGVGWDRAQGKAEAALAAYNSAQKAEGVAWQGHVVLLPDGSYTRKTKAQMDDDDLVVLDPSANLITALSAADAFERGRQQGMEQANALWEMAKTSEASLCWTNPAPNASVPMAPNGESKTIAVGVQPAASSAQEPEPGWVMVPVEPTREMLNRAMEDCGDIGGGSCGEHRGADWDDMRSVWSSMLAAAPARLTGATQGEAEPIGWMTPTEFENLRKAYECHDNRAFIIRPRREPDLIPTIPVYTHPQAPAATQPEPDQDEAIRIWHKHCDAFASKLGVFGKNIAVDPPSCVIKAMMEFAAKQPVAVATEDAREALLTEAVGQFDHMLADLIEATTDEYGLTYYAPKASLIFSNFVGAMVAWRAKVEATPHPTPAVAAEAGQGEREAFEAWAATEALGIGRLRHSYANTSTAWCWDAWQARAALTQPAPPSQGLWRDIATAPKDGSEILLTNGQVVHEGHWLHAEGGTVEHRDLNGRYIDQTDSDGYDGWIDWSGGMLPEPTNWMPLPAAPTQPPAEGEL